MLSITALTNVLPLSNSVIVSPATTVDALIPYTRNLVLPSPAKPIGSDTALMPTDAK